MRFYLNRADGGGGNQLDSDGQLVSAQLGINQYAVDFEERCPPHTEPEFSWIYWLKPYHKEPKVPPLSSGR